MSEGRRLSPERITYVREVMLEGFRRFPDLHESQFEEYCAFLKERGVSFEETWAVHLTFGDYSRLGREREPQTELEL